MLKLRTGIRRFPFFTGACLVTFFILLGLGTWQVQRLQWKNAIIADLEARLALPAEAIVLEEESEQPKFTKVSVSGQFLHMQEILLQGKYFRRKQGYHVVTPLLVDRNRVVLVNRGWIPQEKKEQEDRADTLVTGEVGIEGMLRESAPHFWFMPANMPEKNFWFTRDIAEIAAHVQTQLPDKRVYPVFVQAMLKEGEELSALPYPLEARILLRNDHLQYAITWYALALTVLVMYVFFARQKSKEV